MEENKIREYAVSYISKMLKSYLNVSEIKEEDNLIKKGLSSIQIMKISAGLKNFGLRLSFAKLMDEPTVETWIKLIKKASIRNSKKKDMSKYYTDSKKFKLTDVQYAYLVGREEAQILGGIGCHAYLEIDGENIDVDKLTNAWNMLQDINPMLRAKFNKNGTQQIMEQPYSKEIKIFDYTTLSLEEAEIKMIEIRNRIAHRKLNIDLGEVASLSVVLLKENKHRIFFDIDILVADIMSIGIIIDELSNLYNRKDSLEKSDYTFKNYLEEREIDKETYEKDKQFWQDKIKSGFPLESPNLPLKKKPEMIENIFFSRRKRTLDEETWNKIKENACKNRVTPSMVLLACYSMVIERWINQDKFIINVPLFNRDICNKDIKNMVADFTNLLLVECERKDETFISRVKTLSDRFLENVSHSSYSGIEVQRSVYKEVGKNINLAPIVFACNIDYSLETQQSRKVLGKINYMVSQTPQVWLDFQTYLQDGEIILCWDTVDELYPDKMIDDMFNSLEALLHKLTDNDNWYQKCDVLPLDQRVERENELNRILPLDYPNETLYTNFLKMVEKYPNKSAIIDGETGHKITYEELYSEALKVASNLISNGVKKGYYIGITLPRGYRQIIGILGVLFTGAAYVPIGINQPSERRLKIYEQIGITHILSDKNTASELSLNDEKIIFIDIDNTSIKNIIEKPVDIDGFSTAYVIMTSGTTGVPKGVEIAHCSAINTINDLNEKYKINSNDSVIMVSAIDFDLSVYDIFGLLAVGGTIITLNDDNFKDPDLWLNLISKYNITIWDSVPILFDMLVTIAEGKEVFIPLRIVFLSGDWIATTLPERFYNRSANSIVVGMGGGTEASIWSNFINIPKEIPKDWISIPYGKALKNQVYRVVDEVGRICPNYVEGELWIGGVGVAKGYRGDKKLTDKKFIKMDNIKWYRTGDKGRTWNDGTIEFLGRLDNQVKVKGHRIELGEIEDALLKNSKITKAIAEVIKVGTNNQLVALVESAEDKSKDISEFDDKLKLKIKDTQINYTDYKDYLYDKNNFATKIILDIFKNIGIKRDKYYSLEKIMEIGDIDLEYKELITRWLDILVNHNFIKKKNNNYIFSFEENMQMEIVERYYTLIDKIMNILQGKLELVNAFYSNEFELNPMVLLKNLRNYEENIERIVEIIKKVYMREEKELKILEIGGRDVNFTRSIFNLLKGRIKEYKYADNSLFFKDIFDEINEKYNQFEFINIDNIKSLPEKFDIIIFYNSLHRFNNINEKLCDINTVLSNDGIVLGTEINSNLLLTEISAGILEKGFKDYNLSKRKGLIIPDNIFMSKVITDCKYKELYLSDYDEIQKTGNMVFVIKNKKFNINTQELSIYLKDKLPEYMLPFKYIEIGRMPINKNGKIDRKKLRKLIEKDFCKQFDKIIDYESKDISDSTTEQLIKIYKSILNQDIITIDSNYFNLGGDSLTATKLVGEIKEKFEVEISVGYIFSNPILRDMVKFIKENKKTYKMERNYIEPDIENINKPFNLTDVQFAYWIGRSGAYSLGSVSTHCYFEFDCYDIKVNRLQRVINDMISYHPMLRIVILKNGKQKILEQVPPFILKINDLTSFNEIEQSSALKAIRDEMSHEVLNTDKWPLFNLKMSIINEHNSKLHVSLDNIILDGWSMLHFLKELKERYDTKQFKVPECKVSFRDYVLTLEEMKKTTKYKEDKKYWLSRLDSFLDAPKFNVIQSDNNIDIQSFKRREKYIEAGDWYKLKRIASKNNITPVVLLITLFAESIRGYSVSDEFVLNITQFNREQIHPDINKILGDFTRLTYLEITNPADVTFIDKARIIQDQLYKDINHSLYSAVEFGRELRNRKNKEKDSLMPIVFTSGLGLLENNEDNWIGELVYNISQTPQVWLDHQVMEFGDKLKLIWDSVDEMFPVGLLDKMFDKYISLIDRTLKESDFMDKIIPKYERKHSIENLDKKQDIVRNDYKNYVYDNVIEKENYIEDEEISEEIISLLKKILNVKKIKYSDDFFSLGGDSLTAVQLINLINEKFNINLSVISILKNSNILNLIKLIISQNSNKLEEISNTEEGFF